LQESEMRLRIAQDGAQLGIHDYDILNNQIYWDNRVRELWGIPPDRAITYEVFLEGLHPEDKTPTQAAIDRALDPTGNRDYYAEYRVIRQADHVERWVAATGQVFFDQGRAVRLVGMVQEITQRKQAEAERERLLKEVQRQKDLLEQLIQHSPIGIALLQGPEHRFVLVNPAQNNLFPLIPDFTGHTVAEVWPDQSELYKPVLDRVFQTGEPYYAIDAPWQTDKGQGVEEVFYTFSYTPIYQPNGVIEGILVLSLETTEQVKARQRLQAELDERRQMEAALQESESRFRTMADGTPVMIWVHDPEGGMEFVNQAYTDYFGVTLEQVKAEGWQPLVHPEDSSGYVDVFIECLQQHRTFRAQCRVRRPDGKWCWIDSHGQPRFSATGEFIGMAGSSFDITQRKQAEEANKRYAGQLEQLNRDLAFANRELKDFTYVASHDLQEPLRKVSQFGRLLQMNAGETLTEDNHVYLDRMVDAAKRMQEMIAGLLDYSRITTQGNPFTQVDLSHLAREVLSDLEVRIEQTEGSVDIKTLPVIDADPLLMRQLFQNLIGNALKFHRPNNPPIVKVWAEDNDMEGNPAELVCLYFQDNGIGFDEQHLEKLFQPFMRLHGRSNYEGNGMGLSICRKIAERHRGKITAKSIPEDGATFIVTLPKRQNIDSEQSSELMGTTK
jgi:two-component system, chemotaxis family, CheB/CheR fusion protein